MPQTLPTPQRITIPSSAIVSGQSLSIPLHVFPIPAGSSGYKVGIMVQAASATDENQSTTPQLFEFDTGGQGFWMNPNGTLPAPAFSDCNLNIQYTSGIQYWAAPQTLKLTFTEAAPPLTATATVGVIGRMQDSKSDATAPTPQSFPIFGHFYGDFGATLQPFGPTGPNASPANTLLTVLAQLPTPYNTGFIVDVGPFPDGKNDATSPPQLIVGLNQPLRDLFPITIAMTPDTPYLSPSGATFPTFTENVIQGGLQITAAQSGQTSTVDDIGVVFDTGAPKTVVHTGKLVTSQFEPKQGDWLQLTPNFPVPTYSLLSFEVGGVPGQNSAASSSGDVLGIESGYINTGITAFFQSPVMFDLQNGLIGFPPSMSQPPRGQ